MEHYLYVCAKGKEGGQLHSFYNVGNICSIFRISGEKNDDYLEIHSSEGGGPSQIPVSEILEVITNCKPIHRLLSSAGIDIKLEGEE